MANPLHRLKPHKEDTWAEDCGQCQQSTDPLSMLRSEVEEALKDRDRLDWLQKNAPGGRWHVLNGDVCCHSDADKYSTPRRAIDAAMLAEEESRKMRIGKLCLRIADAQAELLALTQGEE